MNIIINESQVKILKEAIGFGFSLGYLKSLDSFAKKVAYCKEFLGNPIGNGSSRICFQLDDEKILKLAKNAKGIAQNEEEGQYDYMKDSYECFPEVFRGLSDTDDFSYLVSEYVLPAKATDIKKCFGFDVKTFFSFINKCAKNCGQVRGWSMYGDMKDEMFSELLENYQCLADLYDYIGSYSAPVGDMYRLANWGLVNRDGQMSMVLLDSGLSDEIYKSYYKR